MSYEVTLLVFGILLLLLGLVGKIKAKEIEVGTSSVIVRVVTLIIGFIPIVLSFNPEIPKNFLSGLAEQKTVVEKTEQARLEEERRKVEQARLEEERRKAEQVRLEEERRKAEQVRLEEERRKAEQARLEEERRKTSLSLSTIDMEMIKILRLLPDGQQ